VDLFEEYERFRAGHRVTRRQVDGACWEYIASGQGPETIVMLPGALGDAETSFQYITAFEPHYRVLALTYPPSLSRVVDVTGGIAGLMDAEGIERAHLIGGSFSGMLAQCFVREYPARLTRLILSHTGVPSRARLRSSELYLRVILARSLGAVRLFARLANHAAFLDGTTEHLFWRAYFDRTIASISRAELAMRVRLVVDFDQNYRFAVEDLREWCGQMLIVDSESDRYIAPAERLALRSLYPHARVCSLEGTGHSGTLESAERYIRLYGEFLRG
jgi:pimeloyl-ACP methyl ester carboxylesterase